MVLTDVQGRGLRYTLNCAEAEGSILSVAPGVHLTVGCECQYMSDSAGDLHDLGAELWESDHGGPSNDRHLGHNHLIVFRAF